MLAKEIAIKNHIEKIKYWVQNRGPEESEWEDFNKWVDILFFDKEKYEFTQEDMKIILEAFGDSIKIDTLQGYILNKPNGYPGDFLIIDSLYTFNSIRDNNHIKWDKLCLNAKGVVALRNRKAYFINLLLSKLKSYPNGISVLNVASGPCRDLKEFFQIKPDCKINCDCLEQDIRAINYAKIVLDEHSDKIKFICKNALKFYTDKKYDLIWSGGLFDYFTDNIFVRLLKRYYNFLNKDGEIVIGNFSPNNPSKNYMELMDWHLNYREEKKLIDLAKECGFVINFVSIDKESTGINLFLHIKKH